MTTFDKDKSQNKKATYALASLAGILGSTVDGLSFSAIGAEILPQLASLAVPGLAAWVIAYVMFKNSSTNGTAPLALISESAEAIPERIETAENSFDEIPDDYEEPITVRLD